MEPLATVLIIAAAVTGGILAGEFACDMWDEWQLKRQRDEWKHLGEP